MMKHINLTKWFSVVVLSCFSALSLHAEWPAYAGTDGITGQYDVLNKSELHTLSSAGITSESYEYELNGPGNVLTFSARKSTRLPDAAKLRVYQYIDGNWSNAVWSNALEKDFRNFSVSIDKRATKIKFETGGGGLYDRQFKDVKVSMAQYKDALPGSVDFGLQLLNSAVATQTISLDWSNVSPLLYSLSDPDKQFEVAIENNASVGKFGTATISIRYLHSALGEHSATLYIDNQAITLHGITKGEHHIRWNQNLMGYVANADGSIDETTRLTAYAADSLGVPTNVPIRYTIEDTSIAELIDHGDGTYSLHIRSIGTTYIHATTEENDTYATATATREIRARRQGESCKSLSLYAPDVQRIFTINSTDPMPLSGVPDQLTFEAYEQTHSIFGNNYFHVQYSTDNALSWANLTNPSLSTDYQSFGPYDIPEGTTHIRFATTVGATLYKYVRNVKVTEKSYLTASDKSLTINAFVNRPVSQTIEIHYSDIPLIHYSLTNHNGGALSLLPLQTIDNDCGDFGTYRFRLQGKFSQPVDCQDTIRFRTSAGDYLAIPLSIHIELDKVFTFDVAAGEWSNSTLWTYNATQDHGLLPDAASPVEIACPVVINTAVEAYSVLIKDGGSITIAPTGGLTVYAGGISGANKDNLTIENTPQGAGFFRLSPDATTPMPVATIRYATKSTLDTGVDKDATWQYVGAPADGVQFDKDSRTWIYLWDEQNGWTEKTASFTMTPFAGYALTQYGQPTYSFSGQLINGDHEVVLTRTETGMKGENVFVNSYAAPIDVATFTADDFSEGVERTFYLFNSGSWNQWNAGEADASNLGSNGDDTPGHYCAIPVLAAGQFDSRYDITTIPPMQGVYVVAQTDGATIRLNYQKHVWNAQSVRMNEPMRAPHRVSDTASVVSGTASVQRRLRLCLNSGHSGADRIYLLEDSLYSAAYDNGFDALKQLADGLANLYINDPFGKTEVSATNRIDSTFVGFLAGEDTLYTLTATSLIGDSLYLLDTANDSLVALSEGMRYTFSALPHTDHPSRFRILTRRPEAPAPAVPSAILSVVTTPTICVDRECVRLSGIVGTQSVALYSVGGKLLYSAAIQGVGVIRVGDMPCGVYVLRVGDMATKVVLN